tara:strand:- start:384 stop:641 length:258 start_codon:yes stop_codon:yes gene_type:complete
MSVFDAIENKKNHLGKKIEEAGNVIDLNNINKIKRIHKDLDNMLGIWKNVDKTSPFKEEDLKAISDTTDLLIKKADSLFKEEKYH